MAAPSTNKNVVFRCTYHAVWCPKYRRAVLMGPVVERLKEIILLVAAEMNVKVREMEVMPDHVHLLLDVDPQFGIHKVIKRMKGRSSHDLRAEFSYLKSRLPTLWTNSYFVATVGGAPLAILKQYIEDQKKV